MEKTSTNQVFFSLPNTRNPIIYLSAALLSIAGIAHLSLISSHAEILIISAFFAIIGIAQLATAALVLIRRSFPFYRLLISGTLALVGLYFVTRIVPLPFPLSHHGEPEAIDSIGILVKSVEIVFAGLVTLAVRVDKTGGISVSAARSDAVTPKEKRNGKVVAEVYIAIGILILGFLAGIMTAQSGFLEWLPKAALPVASAAPAVEYSLVVEEKSLDMGAGVVWKAWTYNGSVPGPTLKVKVGETLRVKLINKHNLIHSFHTHTTPYEFQHDGSQANLIAGVGAKSMVSPREEYVYEFHPSRAGIYYYHCHSTDGGRPINFHILQGLYGALVVEDPETPRVEKEFVVFMAEIGGVLEGTGSPPPYLMNGMGIPGGEHTLETIFKQRGLQGVAEQFNKTVPTFKVKLGENIRMHVINIGNLIHSFHLHGQSLISEQYFPRREWPANVMQLVPGAGDTVVFNTQYDGVWLFHCHVVSHADGGMIGVLIVEK